jgi:hypothetical protein
MRTCTRHGPFLELTTTMVLLIVVAMGGISRRLACAAEIATFGSTRNAPCQDTSSPVTPGANPAHFDGDREEIKDLRAVLAAAPISSDLVVDCQALEWCAALRALPAAQYKLLSLQACLVRLQV